MCLIFYKSTYKCNVLYLYVKLFDLFTENTLFVTSISKFTVCSLSFICHKEKISTNKELNKYVTWKALLSDWNHHCNHFVLGKYWINNSLMKLKAFKMKCVTHHCWYYMNYIAFLFLKIFKISILQYFIEFLNHIALEWINCCPPRTKIVKF